MAPVFRAVFRTKTSPPVPGHVPISPRIASLLENPTWSVRSLLPKANEASSAEDTITSEKLHHLLKLSALPLPPSEKAELKLLKIFQAQIHFVKEIQKISIPAVEPLQAIRDETTEAIEENTITIRDLKPYFDNEEKIGKNRRVRRRKDAEDHGDENTDTWNPFGMSSERLKKNGKNFMVKQPKKVGL